VYDRHGREPLGCESSACILLMLHFIGTNTNRRQVENPEIHFLMKSSIPTGYLEKRDNLTLKEADS